MAAAVKPGGWLFTCEPDFNLVRTSEPQVWREAWAGIIKWGESQGVNWFIGRNLPMIRDRAIGAGFVDATTLDAASPVLDDPDCWTQCWMLTSVWVREPDNE